MPFNVQIIWQDSIGCRRLGSGPSFLGAYLVHLGSFKDGHKVVVCFVRALLHLLVVGHALLDLGAQESQLCQLLGDIVGSPHLLWVGDSGVKNGHSRLQTLLSANILGTVSLRHAKLVVDLGDRPGVCRQSLDPLGKTKGQILHSLLEVRILETHLSQACSRLPASDSAFSASVSISSPTCSPSMTSSSSDSSSVLSPVWALATMSCFSKLVSRASATFSSISDLSSVVMASVSSTKASLTSVVLVSMSTPSRALPRTPDSTLLSSSKAFP